MIPETTKAEILLRIRFLPLLSQNINIRACRKMVCTVVQNILVRSIFSPEQHDHGSGLQKYSIYFSAIAARQALSLCPADDKGECYSSSRQTVKDVAWCQGQDRLRPTDLVAFVK